MRFFTVLLFVVVFPSFVVAQEQFSVYFNSNQFELTPIEFQKLNQWITNNASIKVVGIHGFCDEDGSSGFNDTLAKKRISFVYNQIKDQLKIREDFKTRSFGELQQLSKIKAENRKVTLFYLQAKDWARENELLGIPEAAPLVSKLEIVYPEKLAFQNPDGTSTEFQLDRTFMKKISTATVGEKLKIENLNFKINTYIVNPESKGKMYELLLVLQKNPLLKVEIQGHLCCMPIDRLDLSTQRAKAINNFLVANGIDESRLTFKGFGSTHPIYPLPEKDEAQRTANRRVEIMIVAN